jgi:hypothetical protein
MAFDADGGLNSAIEEVRKALDKIPHGEAKQLLNPLEKLIQEALWINIQRDAARLLDPNRTSQAYWLLFSHGKEPLNHPTEYTFALADESDLAKLRFSDLQQDVEALVTELNAELGTEFTVRTFKQSYMSESKNLVNDRVELKGYLSNTLPKLKMA